MRVEGLSAVTPAAVITPARNSTAQATSEQTSFFAALSRIGEWRNASGNQNTSATVVDNRGKRDVDSDDSRNASTKTTLTPEQLREIQHLASTDRRVRQHEQMHIAVGGELITSGPTYDYKKGPDGRHYAVGGEVGIDTSPARTAEETVPKARKIRATALAPPDPSPQDRSVAACATQMELQAQMEISLTRARSLRSSNAFTTEQPQQLAANIPPTYASRALRTYEHFSGASNREVFSLYA